MFNRGRTVQLAADLVEGDSGSWLKVSEFVGPNGSCTIMGYGMFGGTTITIEIAADASGAGSQTITDASYTAAFSKVFTLPKEFYVRVVSTGGSSTLVTVLATPVGG